MFNIDDVIPFIRRKEHQNQTIRQIIRFDSGYLKDLFLNDERVVFSEECFAELCRLTKDHRDNWEEPEKETSNVFDSLKTYRTPYLHDFNDEKLKQLNQERLSKK